MQSIHERLGALTERFYEYATLPEELHVVVIRALLREQDLPVYVQRE